MLLIGSKMDAYDYEVLFKAMVRIMCKPRPGVDRICIKPRPQCVPMMTEVSKLDIHIRHVFIYRNYLNTLRSWLALMTYDPFAVVVRMCTDVEWFSNIIPYYRNVLRYYFIPRMKTAWELPMNSNTVCVYTYMWANQIQFARDAMARDPNILSVKYESTRSEPTRCVEQLFESSGMDTRFVEGAVATLSRDSQRGSAMSRENLGDSSHRNISEEDIRKCDAILNWFKLPRLGEDFRF